MAFRKDLSKRLAGVSFVAFSKGATQELGAFSRADFSLSMTANAISYSNHSLVL